MGQSIAVAARGQMGKHKKFKWLFLLWHWTFLFLLSFIRNVPLDIFNVLLWIINCECGEEEFIYSILNCIQVFSILKQPFIIQQHSLYPCDIQYAWCLGPIPNPTRLFYCMIAVLYIILPLCHPPIYPSHSLSSLTFLPPLLLLYKGRSVWALWTVICTTWFNYL